ncbi:MAG: serine/threonine protein phosphatase [Oscillibacter sp.]|nr:serine/threonine protein phosphatase [Oscillibacter sp.]
MKLFRKKTEPAIEAAATPQIKRSDTPLFGMLGGYTPLQTGEKQLYRAIRESVPLVDACIYKIIRLCGGVTAVCEDPEADRELKLFLERVDVGRGQRGINAFLDQYLDSMLVFGQAVGEIVPTADGRDVAAVLCGRVEDIQIQEGDGPLDFQICGQDEFGQFKPLPRQQLLLFTPFNPETYAPYGVSLLRSMPFLTELLSKIYYAIGVNWERMGNVRFAVVYKPGDGEWERGMAQERSRQLANEWSRAMESTRSGSVRDFVAVGDVDIKVIGADNQILDSSVPIRQILEQLVSKTGIPPFMLGLSWSSTERMSTQQADMLTTEMTAIRRALTPAVERICQMWLRMHGYGCGFQVVWDDINLQDLVEEAKAEWYREQTRKLALENDAMERAAGRPGLRQSESKGDI